MRTVLLLFCSNIFMTIAWYGHLKFANIPLWKVVLVSWGIAFFEYCFQVPANRIGFVEGFNGYQLKMIQEVITLTVFCLFAVFYLKEPLKWNYLASFGCVLAAVYFMFRN
ncbi:DMT family protein [Compostibacter hankyongensis]|uniref:DMT family protein n=1 Tax=Compostibacter hankyongensis TaxID=1007089 RepID=A0ABP8FJF3_9BACT